MSVIIHELDITMEAPEKPEKRGGPDSPEPAASAPQLTPQDLEDVARRQHLRDLRVRAS